MAMALAQEWGTPLPWPILPEVVLYAGAAAGDFAATSDPRLPDAVSRLDSGAPFDRADADVVLRARQQNDPRVAHIPSRPCENSIRIDVNACVFFVAGGTAAGKRKCADGTTGAGPGANGDEDEGTWVKFGASSASGGSLKDEKQPGPPYKSAPPNPREGILKTTSSMKPEHKVGHKRLPSSISIFQIVGLEDHPQWNEPQAWSREVEVKARGAGRRTGGDGMGSLVLV